MVYTYVGTGILQGSSVFGFPLPALFISLLLAAAFAPSGGVGPEPAFPESVGYFVLSAAHFAMPQRLVVDHRNAKARIFVAPQLAVTTARAMRVTVLSPGSFGALTRRVAAG